MDVKVYNERGQSAGRYMKDRTRLVGDSWEEVLDEFERTWQFAPGQLFVLVSSDDLDPVRVIRATTNVVLEPVT